MKKKMVNKFVSGTNRYGRRTTIFRPILSALLLLLLLIVLVPAKNSYALQYAPGIPFDSGRDISLHVDMGGSVNTEEKPVLRLYHIADYSENGWVIDPLYKNYPLVFKWENDEAVSSFAETVKGYILRDKIPASYEKFWPENGRLSWSKSADRLKPGLYLLLSDAFDKGEERLIPQNVLTAVPGALDEASSDWKYDVQIVMKTKTEKLEYKALEALKLWNDGDAKDRPKSVTVQLLKDGKVSEEVKLSADNNWRHTWEKLSARHDWTLVEKTKAKNYTVSISSETVKDKTFYKIKNTKPGTPPKNPPGKLTNTGANTLPVYILSGCGILMILLSFTVKRKNEKQGKNRQ